MIIERQKGQLLASDICKPLVVIKSISNTLMLD